MARNTDRGTEPLKVVPVNGAREQIEREMRKHADVAWNEPGSKVSRGVARALQLVLDGPSEGIPAAVVQMQTAQSLRLSTRLSREDQHAVMDRVHEIVKSANSSKTKGRRARPSSSRGR